MFAPPSLRSIHLLLFTIPIITPEYSGLRVTPNVYTTVDEIDAFADEMERVAVKGLQP